MVYEDTQMQQTKELLVLNDEQKDIIRKWYQHVNTITTADNAVIFKINCYKTTLLTPCDCSIILKWWNYLDIIDSTNKDLYEELYRFSYGTQDNG